MRITEKMLVSQTVIPHCLKFRWLYPHKSACSLKTCSRAMILQIQMISVRPAARWDSGPYPRWVTEDYGKKRTKRRLTRGIEERCWI